VNGVVIRAFLSDSPSDIFELLLQLLDIHRRLQIRKQTIYFTVECLHLTFSYLHVTLTRLMKLLLMIKIGFCFKVIVKVLGRLLNRVFGVANLVYLVLL